MRQQGSHAEWQQYAHAAGHDSGHSMSIKLLVIEFHSYEEKKKHQPDRGEGFKRAEGTDRKERGGEMGGKAPEDRRSNEDAADDLADHARLADFKRKPAAANRDQQDDGHLGQQQGHVVQSIALLRLCGLAHHGGTGKLF